MIISIPPVIFSKDANANREFFRDVLRRTHVDAGEGWFIFGLSPTEIAVHPSDENNIHEFYLMRQDINAFIAEIETHEIVCSEI